MFEDFNHIFHQLPPSFAQFKQHQKYFDTKSRLSTAGNFISVYNRREEERTREEKRELRAIHRERKEDLWTKKYTTELRAV